ncbi:MAG: choice-of-anchor D domain-containing protein [Pseudomonadales bacterium]|nr:choice-of-anchor D domain-containing protein [Pseudomonadales bacterium]
MIPHNVNVGPFKMRSLAAAALLAASGAASAIPVEETMYFQCTYPLIGQQPLSANIQTDMPESIGVGEATGAFTLNITATAEGNTWQGLSLVGAATIEGTAEAESTVSGNSLNLPLTIPLNIPVTNIEGVTGPFDLVATGDTPSLTFTQDNVGMVDIFVEENMSLGMIARRADGTYVDFGSNWHDPDNPEVFLVDCVMDQARMDQNGVTNLLHSFEVETVEEDQNIDLDVEELDFGQLQGGLTETQTVTVENTGGLPLGINGVGITGTDAGAFMQQNTCSTLAPGETCTVDVTFMPTGEGPRNATLEIQSDDPDTPTATVELMGVSVVQTEADIAVDPQSVNFGSVTVGSSADSTLSILNEGTAALNINSVSVGGANASEFIQDHQCATIAAGESCDVDLTFTPAGEGAKDATLTIQSSDPDEASVDVPLSGSGISNNDDDVEVPYALTGNTHIKKARGDVDLSGEINALLNLATGDFTADLALEPTSGSFRILFGWKRVTAEADIDFEPVGETTGNLGAGGNLTAETEMYIKLPKVEMSIFGWSLPVGGGDQCRTSEPVSIQLNTPEGESFDPLGTGGSLVGTYDLPGLENCGGLTDLLNVFMAGSGNTIELSLTPNL